MSYAHWNPQAGDFIDVEDVNDVNPLKPTITQTYEVGYKGILRNRLAFSVDVYHSRINDFVGPLVVETPNVFLDATTLGGIPRQTDYGGVSRSPKCWTQSGTTCFRRADARR